MRTKGQSIILALLPALFFAILLTLYYPIPFFSRLFRKAKGEVEIRVETTGKQSEASQHHEVWVYGIFADGRRVPQYELELTGNWQVRDGVLLNYDATPNFPASITWRGTAGQSLQVDLLSHDWSGIVDVTCNDMHKKVDLYASPAHRRRVRFPCYMTSSLWLKPLEYFLSGLAYCVLLFIFFFSAVFFRANISPRVYSRSTSAFRLFYIIPPLLVWGLYGLALYPGLFSNDSIDQWQQLAGGYFSNHHPAWHTLTLWLVTRLYPSPAAVIALHLLVGTGVVVYMAASLEKAQVPRYWIVAAICFTALAPINGFMMCSLWKDILYALVLLWLIGMLIRVECSNGAWLRSKVRLGCLAAALTAAILYRHNGMAVAAGVMMALFVIYKRQWRALLAVTATIILALCVVHGVIFRAAEVRKGPKFYFSKVTLPLRQIAVAVSNNFPFARADLDTLEGIAPKSCWAENANQDTIMRLAFSPEFKDIRLKDRADEIYGIWLKQLRQDPLFFTSLFFKNSEICWRLAPAEPMYSELPPILLPWRHNLFYNLEEEPDDFYQLPPDMRLADFPVPWAALHGTIADLCSSRSMKHFAWPPYYLVPVVAFMLHLILRKGVACVLPFVPVFCNWFSMWVILPSNNMRYFYITILAAPFLIAYAFRGERCDAGVSKSAPLSSG